ncbi:hypothetical protein ABEB36_001634 [Hypothenemus hampei]|uniref:Uncharacterized protein n=1 Tax=Hypothenemus hampei TaxID=57062 RepID=A0ABD1FIR1_HYPHA
MIRNEETDDLHCQYTNSTTSHPFIKNKNVKVAFSEVCNEDLEYLFTVILSEDHVNVYENFSINVPVFEEIGSIIHPQDYCIEYFNEKPGVLVCVQKNDVTAPVDVHLSLGQFTYEIFNSIGRIN